MSRTTRSFASDANYREARKGAGSPVTWAPFRGSGRGGLLLSPRPSGRWPRERLFFDASTARVRERRRWLRDTEDDR